MRIYFYFLTFTKLLFWINLQNCVSEFPIVNEVSIGNVNNSSQPQTQCTRVEDVKLTFQEWSETILVSLTHSYSSSSSSSSKGPILLSTNQSSHAKELHIKQHHLPPQRLTLKFVINKTNYDLTLHPYKDFYREPLKITIHANQTISKSIPRNCYFYGSSWRSRRTLPMSAFINSCDRTSGLILLGEVTFVIKSVDLELCEDDVTSKSHIGFKIPGETDKTRSILDPICGTTDQWKWIQFQQSPVHRAEYLRNLKIAKSKKNNKLQNCLMVKLGLILDNSLIMKLNTSIEDMKHQMMLLSNILNQLLKDLHKNLQLELVHIDLWKDGDLFTTSKGVRWTLNSLVGKAKMLAVDGAPSFHYLHLLSGQDTDNLHYGASIPDSICTERAVGVSYVDNPDDMISMAVDIIHMFGHVIGLDHDGVYGDAAGTKDQKCSDSGRFVMTSKKANVSYYSPNSHQSSSSSSPQMSSLSSDETNLTKINKHKRNNVNNDNHRHRHHHFHMEWSSCSLHDFNLNVKSKFLGCLKIPCNNNQKHQQHQHQPQQHQQNQHHQQNQQQHPEDPIDLTSRGNNNTAGLRYRGGNDNDEHSNPREDNYDDGDDDNDAPLPIRDDGPTKRYSSKCGNGILERGEECDCGSKQDCLVSDPCCDMETCLLKPWTSCRKGDCCFNCSLSSSNHVCRENRNSCDVPEFCTGTSEECPEDSTVYDGQPCVEMNIGDNNTFKLSEDGLCYEGRCRSYDQQCTSIWGSGSSKASDGCFSTFNQIGAISGHCGSQSSSSSPRISSASAATPSSVSSSPKADDSTITSSLSSTPVSTEYIKCSQRDVMCGLLQCKGGPQKPLYEDNISVFFEATITSLGGSYQCKVLSNPLNPTQHLVEDGSPCSKDSMCMLNKCVPILDLLDDDGCPRGTNNLACSGNGVCTNQRQCFCSPLFYGDDCSSPVHQSTVPSTPHGDVISTSSVIFMKEIQNHNSSGLNRTNEEKEVVMHNNVRSSANALWLFGAMSCVIIGASAILVLCLVCYRRKTPKLSKKQQICQLRNMSLMSRSSHENDSRVNRIISFGSLPSYRADKLRKAMRGSNHSETESEKSSKRNSAEVNVKLGKEAKATYVPLPAPPDKGILKRPENKSQRRNRATTEDASTNTGSDVSSVLGDSTNCGGQKRNRVGDAEKVRSRLARQNESLSECQNILKDEEKSVRNSLVTMPDILPKASDHNESYEIENDIFVTSKRDSFKVVNNSALNDLNLSCDNGKGAFNENIFKKSKDEEEKSFVEETGTMSSFLSTSDLEASPRPGAPAPSLCSEYSPQQIPQLSSQPLQYPPTEQKRNLKSFPKDAMMSSSSNSPNSSCSTFTSSLSEAAAHEQAMTADHKIRETLLPSYVPLRKSLDRTNCTWSGPQLSKLSNPLQTLSCQDEDSLTSSSSHNDAGGFLPIETSNKASTKKFYKHHPQAFNHLEYSNNIGRNINSKDVFRPDPRGAYTKAPGSPGAPDDDDDNDDDGNIYSFTEANVS